MRPATVCGLLLFGVPLWVGLRDVPSRDDEVRARRQALHREDIASLGERFRHEKDYRFLRCVAARLGASDRLLLLRDFAYRPQTDVAIGLLAGGWSGAVEVVWLGVPPREEAPEALAAVLDRLRRSEAEIGQLLRDATVVAAWDSAFEPPAGDILVDAGARWRAIRLRR